MAEVPLLTRGQWVAISSKEAEAIARHAAVEWYEERSTAFDRESLAMVMMGRLDSALGCKDMAKRFRYWGHMEATNPGPAMDW